MIHADSPEVIAKANHIYFETYNKLSIKEVLSRELWEASSRRVPQGLEQLPRATKKNNSRTCLLCTNIIDGEHGNKKTHTKCRRERDIAQLARYYIKNNRFPHHHIILSSYHVKDDFKGISLGVVKELVIKKTEELMKNEY